MGDSSYLLISLSPTFPVANGSQVRIFTRPVLTEMFGGGVGREGKRSGGGKSVQVFTEQHQWMCQIPKPESKMKAGIHSIVWAGGDRVIDNGRDKLGGVMPSQVKI